MLIHFLQQQTDPIKLEASPGLPPHLEALRSKSNGNLTLGPSILDINLEIVDKPLDRSWLVSLNYTNVVSMKVDVGVLGRELIGRHHEEASRAIDGIELCRSLLVLVHVRRHTSGAEPRLL